MTRIRGSAAVLAAGLVLAACGGGGEPSTPDQGGASGSLGVVTPADARRMVGALCEIAGPAAADLELANAAFYDRAHAELHALAAAVEAVDRTVAARLLVAKERVEADLRSEEPPPALGGDATRLLDEARAALRAVDLPAPDCGA